MRETPIFTKEDGLKSANGKYIANFIPVVTAREEEHGSNGKITQKVKFFLQFMNGEQNDEHTIPLSKLLAIDWQLLNIRCLLNPSFPKAKRQIDYIIRQALPDAPVTKRYVLNHLGVHHIEDEVVYCAGDCVLRSPDANTDLDIFAETPYRFVFDLDRYSEKQAVDGMVKLINLSPDVGRMIFTQSLLGIMRSVFIAAGKAPCTLLYVVAPTTYGKTTYATFLTQLYDRDKGIEEPPQLSGSKAAARRIVSGKRDCAGIFDDFFPSDASNIRRELEEMFDRLARQTGNNKSSARVSGKEVVEMSPDISVIVLGEAPYGKGSAAARCLIVEMHTRVVGEKLTIFQKEPLHISTFYHYFITWYISNFHEIKNRIKKWLFESRTSDIGVSPRLAEAYFFFDSAYKFFLLYCVEKGFTTRENARIESRSFQKLLLILVKAQEKRVKLVNDDTPANVDYLGLIRSLYKSKVFRLADDPEQWKVKVDKFDGLLHGDCLCLRVEKLLEKIKTFNPATTIKDVAEALLAQKALIPCKDSPTKQIYACGNKRFLFIPLKKLKL